MRTLGRKFLRDVRDLGSLLVTLSVLLVCGIGVFVSSWSSYESLARAQKDFYRAYHFAEVFADAKRIPSYMIPRLSSLQSVQHVEGLIQKDGQIFVKHQNEPALGRFVSYLGPNHMLNTIYLREGRLPDPEARLEAVVHESFAKAHGLRPGDVLDVLLSGKRQEVRISGIGVAPDYVYALSPVAPLPDRKHFGIVWLSHEDLSAWTGMQGAYNHVRFKVSGDEVSPELLREINSLLRPFGGREAYGRSLQLSHRFIEDEIRQQKVMAVLVPSIFLGVAMFVIHIVLTRMVAIHRPQIAILKAVGYSRWALVWHYLKLAGIALSLGIIPALGVGAWIGQWYATLYADFFHFPQIDFSLSPWSLLLGILSGLIPGGIGAAWALNDVMKLHPAEAMRPHVPVVYRQTRLDQTLFRFIKRPLSKMTMRTLFYKPWRTGLNVLALSLGISILITGSFWVDVIDAMVVREFHQVRKDHITVFLYSPQRASFLEALQKIPGVYWLEGERVLAARLRVGQHTKEAQVLGKDSHSELHPILNRQGQRLAPPSHGLLMSTYFQKVWGIGVGDHVRVESLENPDQSFEVPVTGFVEDIVGQGAYIDRQTLHRFLDETPSVNQVQLRTVGSLEETYVALQNRPEVMGVSVKEQLESSFVSTVAGMIQTFTGVLYIFALAIVAAIASNAARVGFSERHWELASLRIVGFRPRSVFEVLYLAMGVELLLALAPGLGLGYFFSWLTTRAMHNESFSFPLVIQPTTYAWAVLATMITVGLTGLYLWRKVQSIDLAVALKARE